MTQIDYLKEIAKLDDGLLNLFSSVIVIDDNLNRSIVSFQANKKEPGHRWYKYKEGFSERLVKYLLMKYNISSGSLFDPFAGIGTTLFVGNGLGFKTEGIELLPVSQKIILTRQKALFSLDDSNINTLTYWIDKKPWNNTTSATTLNRLKITDGAYPPETEKKIEQFLTAINKEEDIVKDLLYFALMAILESISFTRKDGQYLRWDYRSGRRGNENTFDKGTVYSFDEAMTSKLLEIKNDLLSLHSNNLFDESVYNKNCEINLYCGSTLEIMPNLKSRIYNGIITSPPYCNRYDYTRTYALEHALLGISEKELVSLRQALLSCTVENKPKELLQINPKYSVPIDICNNLDLLQKILEYLEFQKRTKELNNSGIPRMVRGYFYELACVIFECYRVLKKNGTMFMVNDNVRYAGASISVDLILSYIAQAIGFTIENILVLPLGKGNSSQQMGGFGRDSLRKCVYVWKKEK